MNVEVWYSKNNMRLADSAEPNRGPRLRGNMILSPGTADMLTPYHVPDESSLDSPLI